MLQKIIAVGFKKGCSVSKLRTLKRSRSSTFCDMVGTAQYSGLSCLKIRYFVLKERGGIQRIEMLLILPLVTVATDK